MAELSDTTDIRETVREKYAAAARAAGTGAYDQARASESESGCCGSRSASCCSAGDETGVFGATLYDEAVREDVPEAALSASLGCGVPTAVADLHEGETVLDLGSGAGADVLISARRVGPTGKAIGLDMTDEMLELARTNAAEAAVSNVEFIKGYLEDMPLADAAVDVVISNCVINLSGNKPKVIREAARVLKPGGRFAVSDVIADPDMDERTRADMAAWTGCVAGALTEAEFRAALHDAGLEDVEIRETHRVHEHAGAAIIRARKPVPASNPSACSLDADELVEQLERYRAIGRVASAVEHEAGRVVVRFAGDPPSALIERTLEMERSCCPFFELDYDPVAQCLAIGVDDPDRRPGLETIAHALTDPGATGSLPDSAQRAVRTAPGGSSCCTVNGD